MVNAVYLVPARCHSPVSHECVQLVQEEHTRTGLSSHPERLPYLRLSIAWVEIGTGRWSEL